MKIGTTVKTMKNYIKTIKTKLAETKMKLAMEMDKTAELQRTTTAMEGRNSDKTEENETLKLENILLT